MNAVNLFFRCPCAPTKLANESMGYTSKIDLLSGLYVPAVSPNRPLLYPDETGVERSGSRDFSA